MGAFKRHARGRSVSFSDTVELRPSRSISVPSKRSRVATAPFTPLHILPTQLLPTIMSFAGPQAVAALSRCDKYLHSRTERQELWQVMCQEYQKISDDEMDPSDWKLYYRQNPIVPIDYPSLQQALSAADTRRVLVQTGTHVVHQPIVCDRNVTLVAMQPNQFTKVSHRPSLLNRQNSCPDLMLVDDASWSDDSFVSEASVTEPSDPSVATLVTSDSFPSDQPLMHIRSSSCVLQNVHVQHSTQGMDIWNGNCAVHISQESKVEFNGCSITSSSGRGLQVLDASVTLQASAVYQCAAAGIHANHARATISLHSTDITTNGIGSTSGIARGHSGVTIEEGQVSVFDSNLSINASSGIYLGRNGHLVMLQDTDVVGNGAIAVDEESSAFRSMQNESESDQIRRHAKLGNRLLPHGSYRSRSRQMAGCIPQMVSMVLNGKQQVNMIDS